MIEKILNILELINVFNKVAKFIIYIMLACILFVNAFGLQEIYSGIPQIYVKDSNKYQIMLDSEVIKLTLVLALLEALDNILSIKLRKD